MEEKPKRLWGTPSIFSKPFIKFLLSPIMKLKKILLLFHDPHPQFVLSLVSRHKGAPAKVSNLTSNSTNDTPPKGVTFLTTKFSKPLHQKNTILKRKQANSEVFREDHFQLTGWVVGQQTPPFYTKSLIFFLEQINKLHWGLHQGKNNMANYWQIIEQYE